VFSREKLLKCVLSWTDKLGDIDPATHNDLWTPELGAWLSEVRLDGVKLSPPTQPDDKDKVCTILFYYHCVNTWSS